MQNSYHTTRVLQLENAHYVISIMYLPLASEVFFYLLSSLSSHHLLATFRAANVAFQKTLPTDSTVCMSLLSKMMLNVQLQMF